MSFCIRTWRWCRRNVLLVRFLRNWREVIAAYRCGGPIPQFELRNGAKLSGPAKSHLGFLFCEIWIDRTYNPQGYRVCAGNVVVDVGANVGVFSVYAATQAPGVKVYAYEPAGENVKWLVKNVDESRLQNVHVFEQAVTGVGGRRRLHIDRSNGMTHRIAPASSEASGVSVSCTGLDELLESNRIARCDLLKLDCEGSEYEILRDTPTSALQRVQRIVGEYHHPPGDFAHREDLRQLLEGHSFHIDRIVPWNDGGLFFARNQSVNRVALSQAGLPQSYR